MNSVDKQPPKTVDEAVEQIIDELELQDRTLISNLSEYDLKPLQMVLGLYIREPFDKWAFNEELRQSCLEESDEENVDDAYAPAIIIKRVWEKLRETHRLRVVK